MSSCIIDPIAPIAPIEFNSLREKLEVIIREFNTKYNKYSFKFIQIECSDFLNQSIPTTIQELLENTIATINAVMYFELDENDSSNCNTNIINNLKMIIQQIIIICCNAEIPENREFLFGSLLKLNQWAVKCIIKTVVQTMDQIIGQIPTLLHEFVCKVIACWIDNDNISTDTFNFIVNGDLVTYSSGNYDYSSNTHFLIYVFNILFDESCTYHTHINNKSIESIWFSKLLCRFYSEDTADLKNYQDICNAATIAYKYADNWEHMKDETSNIHYQLDNIQCRRK